MSRQEYKALAMGKTIISDVDHKKLGRKSTAKGVCFGIRLCFKSPARAAQFGNQFTDLYNKAFL